VTARPAPRRCLSAGVRCPIDGHAPLRHAGLTPLLLGWYSSGKTAASAGKERKYSGSWQTTGRALYGRGLAERTVTVPR